MCGLIGLRQILDTTMLTADPLHLTTVPILAWLESHWDQFEDGALAEWQQEAA